MPSPGSRTVVIVLAAAMAAQGCVRSIRNSDAPSTAHTPERQDPRGSTGVTGTARLPPDNPFLMRDSFFSVTHWNPAATDTTKRWAWMGDHTISEDAVQWHPLPPSNIGAAHRPYGEGSDGLLVSGNNQVCKFDISGDALDLVHCVTIPGFDAQDTTTEALLALRSTMKEAGTDESAFLPALQAYNSEHEVSSDNLPYGLYTVLDKDGHYYAGWGTTLYKISDDGSGVKAPLKIAASYDLKSGLPPEKAETISRLLGVNITYDGRLVVAMPGIIAVIDRDLTTMEYVTIEGEAIDNSIAVDDKGGIYVVTSSYMRKLVWDGTKLSDDEEDGAWKAEYDKIDNPRALSRGAGNTPTLMGFGPGEDHLVILADAGDPVKIVAFWRDEIPEDFEQKEGTASRRVAATLPLSIDVPATIEWSPQVYGYGTMMFASAWPEPVTIDGVLDLYGSVFTAGSSRPAPRGAEKFVWDPKTRTLQSAWTVDIPVQWALHPVSTSTGTVTLAKVEEGVYSLVALDWESGEEKGTVTLGADPIFNTMGGSFVPMDDGDLLVTGWLGPVRMQMPGNGGAEGEPATESR